jgi:beta-lactam-binding protein with PASTA domain
MRAGSLLVFLLSALGVFVLGVLLFNYVAMPLFIHQYHTVLVPDLTGMSEKQAARVLNMRSLDMNVIRKEYSDEIPEGYVISQNPRVDENVKEGRTISVVLSLGAKMQRVPDLTGLSLRQSRIVLKRNQLQIGRVAKRLLEGDSREVVVGSSPGPGRELIEGKNVDVLVTVGGLKRCFLMPDLSGQDLLFISEKLEKMGFRVPAARYEYRQGAFPNKIIDQSPKPGAQIREGDSIELVAATTR